MLVESVDKVKIRELFEDYESSDSLRVNLTGILSQIRGRIEDTGADKTISLDALLSKLNDAGFPLSARQFIEMSKEEPLNKIIANVSSHRVVFMGQSDDESDALDPEQSTKTLEKMAKRAAKD